MKLLKNILKRNFHGLWDNLSAYRSQLNWNITFLYPQIFKAVGKLSLKEIGTTPLDGKKVLFFAVRQDRIHTAWEFVIAQALKLRGHQVDYIACDGLIQHCCNERWYPELKKSVCRSCSVYAKQFYTQAGFNVDWLSAYYDPRDASEADKALADLPFNSYRSLTYGGFPVGELVRPSVCHFTRTENLEVHGNNDAVIRKIYKDFLAGSIMMVNVCNRILDKYSPDKIILLNGRFMSERIMLELAKTRGIKVISIESGLRPETIVLIDNYYIDYGRVDGWNDKRTTPLTKEQELTLEQYMDSRRSGGGQTMEYWTDAVNDKNKIKEQLNLGSFKKIAVLFPNVTWDSALYGLEVMFDTLQEWIEKTVSYFEKHPQECLIIRTHPADKTWEGGMRDSIYTWIKEHYQGALPANIRVIEPGDPVSSYSLMELADFGLVFSSTTGLEMVLLGKPVVVVGKVHYWGHGFTIDPPSEHEYYLALDRLLGASSVRPGDINVQLAKRYAYFIFYEASLPVKFVYSSNYRLSPPELRLNTYEELLPGKDKALDIICDGIIDDKPFVL